mmetsp:Transcript_6694/g.16337  ORF Transcript_6694/g.16337 Transcript_6694/m.16337 type:complete len:706 (+) Transcript_6694:121-2238(+)
MAATSNNPWMKQPETAPIFRQKGGMSSRRSSLESVGGLSRRSLGGDSRRQSLGASSIHSMVSASSNHTHSHNSGSKNPITNDVKLNILVHEKLQTIKKYKQFQRWKCKFLDRFETYLSQSGMEPARDASRELQVHLETCLKRASVVLDRIDAGDLSPISQKRTVKAARALKEFEMSLELCRAELEELVPAKQIDEKRKRYTKFHVGASLIRDGFPQFVAMKELEEHVHAISDRTYDLETDYDNLNKQERELFCQYKTQVARFCDVMSDLDLYDIMLTCVEFLHPPENDDDDDTEELTIFVKRYQRYNNQQGVIKRTYSNGTDTTNSETDSDNEPSFRGDEDDSGVMSVPPVLAVKLDVEDSETLANVAYLVAQDLGFHLKPQDALDISSQLTIRHGNENVVKKPKTTTLRQLGIEHGDVLTLELAMMPVKIRQIMDNGVRVDLNVLVDPKGTIRDLKFAVEHQLHQRGDGIGSICADDQRLYFGGIELDIDAKSCSGYGIGPGSILDLEAKAIVNEEVVFEGEEDHIVIVDTKYGTMFSVARAVAIKQGVLTPKIVNADDVFVETTEKDFDKDRMLKAMMESPNLKVKPQLVVQKLELEEYDIDKELANDVKNMWGVSLKKTGHERRMTEIFFVDLKTQAVGFLNRSKLLEKNFITVVKATGITRDKKQEEMTLEQAEKDQQKYDFYVFEIRKIFGIAQLYQGRR